MNHSPLRAAEPATQSSKGRARCTLDPDQVDLEPVDSKRLEAQLSAWFERCSGCVVAFSGGVDSSVVAAAAHRSLGDRAIAVTAVSGGLSARLHRQAGEVAAQIGIRWKEVVTDELSNDIYVANAGRRCFGCKSVLYGELRKVCQQVIDSNDFGDAAADWMVISGTNADDLGDYRPGLEAAAEHGVRAPLAELGMGKQAVRSLAQTYCLPNAQAPASPCLASRIAHGLPVTAQRLAMVEAAEAWLESRIGGALRVRLHADDHARIEIPLDRLALLVDPALRQPLVEAFGQFGFRFVSLDLEGLESGRMNRTLAPIALLSKPSM
jgi:pyridinium-3,5-biscarboxylic acid mononucleotide sulfurtransferase